MPSIGRAWGTFHAAAALNTYRSRCLEWLARCTPMALQTSRNRRPDYMMN